MKQILEVIEEIVADASNYEMKKRPIDVASNHDAYLYGGKKPMKVVYVAGPYRAEKEWFIKKNIDNAEKASIEVWRNGGVVICPHKNSAFLGGACDEHNFLVGGLELLKRSDAIYVISTYNEDTGVISEGTLEEIKLAEQLNYPIFYEMDKLIEWLKE